LFFAFFLSFFGCLALPLSCAFPTVCVRVRSTVVDRYAVHIRCSIRLSALFSFRVRSIQFCSLNIPFSLQTTRVNALKKLSKRAGTYGGEWAAVKLVPCTYCNCSYVAVTPFRVAPERVRIQM
jgi:hypothetical protein